MYQSYHSKSEKWKQEEAIGRMYLIQYHHFLFDLMDIVAEYLQYNIKAIYSHGKKNVIALENLEEQIQDMDQQINHPFFV